VKRIVDIHPHAAERLQDREITITECEAVLNNSYADLPGKWPHTRKVYGDVAGRRLALFVESLGNDTYRHHSVVDRDVP